MSSNFHDKDDNNDLVFQDLMPEKPANAFQKRIIHLQRHWPSYWGKRHRFITLTVISGLLVFFLIFEIINASTQHPETAHTTSSRHTTVTLAQVLPAEQIIYIIINNPATNIGTVEAVATTSGMLVWTYANHNTEEIKLSSNILYIQTDRELVALNATTRTPLWEDQVSSDFGTWQTDQNILYTSSSSSIVTAYNGKTGIQLWQIYEPFSSWRVTDGIFYAILTQNLGLIVLNAHNGKLLWHNSSIYQNFLTPVMAVNNGTLYIQNYKNSTLQAFVGASGKLRWQINTHGEDFTPTASSGFLFLSDASSSQVEVVNSQTGILLWQRTGTLTGLTESANQIAISSLLKNETDIIRTTDGTILHHLLHSVDSLLPLENGVVLCTNHPDSTETVSFHVEAIQLSSGATLWSSQVNDIQYLQNNTVAIVSDNGNTLLLRRANTGQTLWQDNF
jgi:outer membrane protein assembly factor BamB